MSSSVNTAVPIIVMMTLVTLIGVIYGTLELYDNESSASDVLKDLLSGNITLWDILEGKKRISGVCSGPDKNGAYEYNQDGKCTFLGCKPGYIEQGGVCMQMPGPSVDCIVDGYTYGECIPKLNETCGEGAGQKLKTPNIKTGAIGSGSCESATYVDCDVKCPDVCNVPDNAYSAPVGVGCMATTPSGESVVLGNDTGYCGEGKLHREIVPDQIPQSVLDDAGYTDVTEYLAYANPNNVCPASRPIACQVECNDGLLDVGCDYNNRFYEFVKDSSGAAICFNKVQTEQFIAGDRNERPDKLKTILAADVRNEDGTYDVEGKIPESDREGLTMEYLSDQGMSYDNLTKNECTLIRTAPCSAPREKKSCIIGEIDVSDCISPGCGQQMYQTVTQGVTLRPFGDGEACPVDYTTSYNRADPKICGTSLKCCGDSDYKPSNICKDTGEMTYTLDAKSCDSDGLPDTKQVDCYFEGEWEPTGECAIRDRISKERRTRNVENPSLAQSGTDTSIEDFIKSDTCDPVNCEGSWGGWSDCSKTCGTGRQTSTWNTSPGGEPKNGGDACPTYTDVRDCNTKRCCDDPADYESSGDCNANGKITYNLDTTSCIQNGLASTKESNCCYKSPWVVQDGCFKDGTIWKGKKTREIENASLCGSNTAKVQYFDDSDCNPVNCVMTQWANSGGCSSSGKQKQTRRVTTAAQYGGDACEEETEREIDCCYRSSWVKETGCFEDGTTWKAKETRKVENPDMCGNKTTNTEQFVDDSGCNPVDCVMTQWANTGGCNSTTGLQAQVRSIDTGAKFGGEACGNITQDVKCPVSCEGGWSDDWGACDCDTGKQTRSWVVKKAAMNNGSCVNKGKTESRDCDRKAAGCPAVCKVKDSRLTASVCDVIYDYDTCVNKRGGPGNQKECNWIPEPTERGQGGWGYLF